MTERTTKGDVETAVTKLNEAAKDLNLDRRFRIFFGSQVQGRSHKLEEIHPGLSQPTETSIGESYTEAERYLRGMRHGLESAKRDRDYRREDATGEGRDELGYPRGMRAPVNAVGIYDPDARSARRYPTDGSVNLGSHPKTGT